MQTKMVSSHSMYKHLSKIAKATPMQKAVSTYQRKINYHKKRELKLLWIIHKLREKETIYGQFLAGIYKDNDELRDKLKILFGNLKEFKKEMKLINFKVRDRLKGD